MLLQQGQINKIQYLLLFVLISGTILIPDSYVVDNSDLIRKYFFSIVSLVFGGASIILKGLKDVKLNNALIIIISGLIVFVVRNPSDKVDNVSIIAFISLLIIMNRLNLKEVGIAKCILLTCIAETTYCLVHHLGIIQENANTFLFSGTFDNPNTFGIFISLCFPFVFFLFKQSKYKLFYILLLLTIFILLIQMKCRTSIICVSLSFVIMNTEIDRLIRKEFFIPAILLFVAVCFCEYKSSMGRILIIMVSFLLFLKMPPYGYGVEGFSKFYMEKQSEILNNATFERFVGLEGNPMHPLNDYVFFVLNVGYIGFIIIFFLVFYFIKGYQHYNKMIYCCLMSIFVSSLFQNCLYYSFVWVFIAICITQAKEKLSLNVHRYRYLIIGVCLFCLHLILSDIQFELKWRRVYDKFCANSIQLNYLNDYAELYKEWNGNPYFLYNYASVLHISGNYERSNHILSQYKKYIVDYQGTLLRAENYQKMKNYELAIAEYKKSHKMCPSRFSPLWGCLQCYRKTDKVEYIKIAKEIRDKKIKVNSYNVQLMKKYCEEVIYVDSKHK